MKDLANDPQTLEWNGTLYKTILSTSETDGAMAVLDTWSPAGSGPPRHVHEAEDEVFIMLEGTCRVWIAGDERIVGPGEAVFVPRGIEHTFRVTDDGPSRHIVILTPGGFEGFFAEMAAGRFRIPQDMPAIGASAARHNLTFNGPPLD